MRSQLYYAVLCFGCWGFCVVAPDHSTLLYSVLGARDLSVVALYQDLCLYFAD